MQSREEIESDVRKLKKEMIEFINDKDFSEEVVLTTLLALVKSCFMQANYTPLRFKKELLEFIDFYKQCYEKREQKCPKKS